MRRPTIKEVKEFIKDSIRSVGKISITQQFNASRIKGVICSVAFLDRKQIKPLLKELERYSDALKKHKASVSLVMKKISKISYALNVLYDSRHDGYVELMSMAVEKEWADIEKECEDAKIDWNLEEDKK